MADAQDTAGERPDAAAEGDAQLIAAGEHRVGSWPSARPPP